MKKDNIVKAIAAAITSAVSGALIGLLMAPEKGSSTRKKIVEESDKYLRDLKETIAELRQSLNNKAEKTKEDLDKFGKETKRKKDGIMKQAGKITSYDDWTKEELYERAKQKEIENYSTMDKAELIEALKNN